MTVMVEPRRELRTQADLAVRISGRDASGKLFAQSAVASSISGGGALLSGMARKVRSGDLIWIEYQDRKARFRIVWVRDSQSKQKTQVAVTRRTARRKLQAQRRRAILSWAKVDELRLVANNCEARGRGGSTETSSSES